MSKHTTVCAGIDTGKYKLDVAIDGSAERLQVDNSPEGHHVLSAWLRQRGVERIGIEASGGYEQAVVSLLRADGFVVIVFQPVQVRAYAKFVLQLRSAASPVNRLPPSPVLLPMTMTAPCDAVRGTSKVDGRACGRACMLPRCQPCSIGTLN